MPDTLGSTSVCYLTILLVRDTNHFHFLSSFQIVGNDSRLLQAQLEVPPFFFYHEPFGRRVSGGGGGGGAGGGHVGAEALAVGSQLQACTDFSPQSDSAWPLQGQFFLSLLRRVFSSWWCYCTYCSWFCMGDWVPGQPGQDHPQPAEVAGAGGGQAQGPACSGFPGFLVSSSFLLSLSRSPTVPACAWVHRWHSCRLAGSRVRFRC